MAASTTPISTYKVYLMYKTGSPAAWAKLIDITDFSDLFGAPETLETTTLSDGARTYILGLQEQEAITCGANYKKSDFTTINNLKDTETDFAIWFGGAFSASTSQVEPTGDDGKYSFKGYVSPTIVGAGVNEVVKMNLTIAPTTVITAE